MFSLPTCRFSSRWQILNLNEDNVNALKIPGVNKKAGSVCLLSGYRCHLIPGVNGVLTMIMTKNTWVRTSQQLLFISWNDPLNNRTLKTVCKLSTRKINKKNNVNGQQQIPYALWIVITIHICNGTAAADGKLSPEGGSECCEGIQMIHQTDDELQNVCLCVCLAKHIHLMHEHFLRRSKETYYLWVLSKAKSAWNSYSLMQKRWLLKAADVTGYFLFKAITASLHKWNWFSSTNRLWIMPWGLVTVVTVTLDCNPVEATSALVVCV